MCFFALRQTTRITAARKSLRGTELGIAISRQEPRPPRASSAHLTPQPRVPTRVLTRPVLEDLNQTRPKTAGPLPLRVQQAPSPFRVPGRRAAALPKRAPGDSPRRPRQREEGWGFSRSVIFATDRGDPTERQKGRTARNRRCLSPSVCSSSLESHRHGRARQLTQPRSSRFDRHISCPASSAVALIRDLPRLPICHPGTSQECGALLKRLRPLRCSPLGLNPATL